MPTPLKVLSIRSFQDMAVAYLLAVIGLAHAPSALAADWHVTTNGVPDGSGTEAAPWDIRSAVDGGQKIEPGDTLWIHQGCYKAEPKVGGTGFVVRH